MKLRHTTLFVLSGLIWFGIGLFLLNLGLNFLAQSIQHDPLNSLESYPLLNSLISFLGNKDNAALAIITTGLLIGYLKGKYVLRKAAQKGIERLQSFANPTSLKNIYSRKYYILIGGMMGLGMLLKVFYVPIDIRGLVDIAIGSALMNGSLHYFHSAYKSKTAVPESA